MVEYVPEECERTCVCHIISRTQAPLILSVGVYFIFNLNLVLFLLDARVLNVVSEVFSVLIFVELERTQHRETLLTAPVPNITYIVNTS